VSRRRAKITLAACRAASALGKGGQIKELEVKRRTSADHRLADMSDRTPEFIPTKLGALPSEMTYPLSGGLLLRVIQWREEHSGALSYFLISLERDSGDGTTTQLVTIDPEHNEVHEHRHGHSPQRRTISQIGSREDLEVAFYREWDRVVEEHCAYAHL